MITQQSAFDVQGIGPVVSFAQVEASPVQPPPLPLPPAPVWLVLLAPAPLLLPPVLLVLLVLLPPMPPPPPMPLTLLSLQALVTSIVEPTIKRETSRFMVRFSSGP